VPSGKIELLAGWHTLLDFQAFRGILKTKIKKWWGNQNNKCNLPGKELCDTAKIKLERALGPTG
jgi:hypothetical protein